MKKLFSVSFSFVAILVVMSTMQVSVTSCKKETKIIRDTIIINDTIEVAAVDTVFVMDVNSWDGYSYKTLGMVSPGATTFTNTAEGIKIFTQAANLGLRLQTKKEISIVGKTIYYKWKPNGSGQFSAYAMQLKYDPTVTDITNVQSIDFPIHTTNSVFNGSILINSDTWYYSRIRAIPDTDKYQFTTSTGNYDNNGGTIVSTKEVFVYTKHGYLGIRLGDPYSLNATLTVAEVKIAAN